MVALDNAPICLRLAGFNHLALVIGIIELKAVLRERRESRASMACNCDPLACTPDEEMYLESQHLKKNRYLVHALRVRSLMRHNSQVSSVPPPP